MGGFVTKELNVIGWSALIGTGLVLGAIVSVSTDAPLLVTLPTGVILLWATLVLLDHRRYRNMHTGLIFEQMDSETGAAVVEMLHQANIEATYFDHQDEWEEGEVNFIDRGINCRIVDVDEARRLINVYMS